MSDIKSETIRTGRVATMLGVSSETVRQLVAKGELTAIRYGTWLQFKPEDVESYVERKTLNADQRNP